MEVYGIGGINGGGGAREGGKEGGGRRGVWEMGLKIKSPGKEQ